MQASKRGSIRISLPQNSTDSTGHFFSRSFIFSLAFCLFQLPLLYEQASLYIHLLPLSSWLSSALTPSSFISTSLTSSPCSYQRTSAVTSSSRYSLTHLLYLPACTNTLPISQPRADELDEVELAPPRTAKNGSLATPSNLITWAGCTCRPASHPRHLGFGGRLAKEEGRKGGRGTGKEEEGSRDGGSKAK